MTHSAVCGADSGGVGQLKQNPPVLFQVLVVDYAPVLVTAFLLDCGQASWDSVPHHGGLVAKLQMAKVGAGLNLHPWISLLILFCVLQGPLLKMLLSLVKECLWVQIVRVWSSYLFIGLQSQGKRVGGTLYFQGRRLASCYTHLCLCTIPDFNENIGIRKAALFLRNYFILRNHNSKPFFWSNSCHILYILCVT